MKRTAPTQGQLLAIAALLLLASSQLTNNCSQRVITPAHNFVASVTIPVASPLKAIGSSMRNRAESHLNLGSADQIQRNLLEQQVYNQQLREHLKLLTAKLDQLAAVRRDRGLPDVKLLDPNVVAWTEGAQGSVLRIDMGKRDGIAEQMVVTAGPHLLGRIATVENGYSLVRPITMPPCNLAATLRSPTAPPNARGPLVQLTLDGNGRRFLGQADKTDKVRVGDIAHLNDLKWPDIAQGFLIGKVVAVADDKSDPLLRDSVVVEPMYDIATLRTVVVLAPGP